MNTELVKHVEKLSKVSANARTGDIASMATLLDQFETLRQFAEIHRIPDLGQPAEALGECIKRIIMQEAEDPEGDMQILRDAVAVIQSSVSSDDLPPRKAYPAGLRWPEQAAGEPAPDSATDEEVREGAEVGAQPEAAPPTPQDAVADSAGSEDGFSLSDLPSDAVGGQEGAFAADEELMGEYLTEQRGRLEEIEGHLLTLEREFSDAALGDLRRALHTIKGDSGFLGLSHVAQISHAAEEYLEQAVYPYDLEYLFAVKDWLTRAFEDLAATGQLAPSTQAGFRSLVSLLDAEQSAAAAPEPSAIEQGQEEPAGQEQAAAQESPAASPTLAQPSAAEPGAQPGRVQLTADESILVDFISESKEHLEHASAQLLSLESDPESEEAVNSVFRAFHTVKGIAGFLDLDEIAKLAHDTENLLDQVRRHELILTPAVVDIVFEALDWMTRLIGNVSKALQSDGMVSAEPELDPFLSRIKAAQEGKLETPAQAAKPGARLGDILVDSGAVGKQELEEAIDEAAATEPDKKLGEVLLDKKLVAPGTIHNALKQQQSDQTAALHKAVKLKETLRVDYDRLENMINTVGELVLAESMISQDECILQIHSETLDKKLYNLRQVSRQLQEMGTTIRMVPISGTYQKMARLVRDLSRKSGKPVNFVSSGDETELDRAYVDLIADPLVHMIRNAVDHGIESPQQRKKLGKPEQGTIALRAFHEGGNIHLEVQDDGQGLDAELIFNKAVEKELVARDEKLTDQEIYQMIFLPGFSTASSVTEVSGRGVGMDVVRRNIDELRGQVQIASERGKGTTFKIILPLTLALIDGMLVKVGQERFIFPVLSVVESTRPTANMINTVIGQGEMISLRNRQLPLYWLHRLFQIPDAKEDITEALVVVVENNGRQVGIAVDDLIGIQQTVIKNLGSGMFQSNGLSGGTIMADGRVGLIVDIAGLINLARNRKPLGADAAI